MSSRFARPIFGLLILAIGTWPLAAQKFQIQYFYDHAKSTFVISDLNFPSANRGVAVGVINDGKRDEPMSVVTSDGGLHWQNVPLKEAPISLFFLNESLGWMVTAKGLWQTVEAGRAWTKLPKLPAEVFRVHFVDETHGWAIGPKKTALATSDGGKTWTRLGAATAQADEDIKYTSYNWIVGASPRDVLIIGLNTPPRWYGPPVPDWMDPDASLRQRQVPHSIYSLTTTDGGSTWKPSSATFFGAIFRVRFGREGKGLELLKYAGTFRYPSEVQSFEWPGGTPHTVYRDSKFDVWDIWLASDGTAYLAGTAVRGRMRGVIPEKVKVMSSKDLQNWTPIPVDYHAEANATILAAAGDDNLWMATDTGMILKLIR